jgi:hypothetical protein
MYPECASFNEEEVSKDENFEENTVPLHDHHYGHRWEETKISRKVPSMQDELKLASEMESSTENFERKINCER